MSQAKSPLHLHLEQPDERVRMAGAECAVDTCECHGVAVDTCPSRGPLGFLRRLFAEWTAGVGRP